MNKKCSVILGLALTGTIFAPQMNSASAFQGAVPALPLKTEGNTTADNNSASNNDEDAKHAVRKKVVEAIDLIRADKFAEARDLIKQYEESSEVPPAELFNLKQNMILKLSRAEKAEGVDAVELSKEYFQSAIDHFSSSGDSPTPLMYLSQAVMMGIEKKSSAVEATEYLQGLVDKLNAKMEEEGGAKSATIVNALIQPLAMNKSRSDINESRNILAKQVEKVRALQESHPNVPELPRALQQLLRGSLTISKPENQDQIAAELLKLADSSLEQSLTQDSVRGFVESYSSLVSSKTRSNPKEAKELLDRAIETLKKLEKEDNRSIIESSLNQLNNSKSRVEAALAQLELIGKPAPAFDAEHWVNGEATSLDALKGKVVLLDFWAVWCGPCIATFPELKRYNQEYSDKGLVILGATRRYGYTWDEKEERAVKPDSAEEVSAETELAMLKLFLDSHELKHPTFVVPNKSDLMKNYGVTGIPHVALIDKAGNVALIQVGSGKESAERIEKKIVELLGDVETKSE